MSSTLETIQEVIRQVFNDPELPVSRDTTAADVEDWDSIRNVALVLELEKIFGIRFSSSELGDLRDVGDLADLVETKRALSSHGADA